MSGFYNSRGDAGLPPGSISCYAGTSSPSGWLLCDGASYSITDYPELYSVISIRYGGSDTHFNVPDLRNLFVKGKSGTPDSTENGADSVSVTLETKHLPSHNHKYNDAYFAEHGGTLGNLGVEGSSSTDNDNSFRWRKSDGTSTSTKSDAALSTGASGSGNAFALNTVPEHKIMNYIIKK